MGKLLSMSQPITHKRMKVTPELALRWLEADKKVWDKQETPHNRPLRQMVVERYARDMKTGRWQYNPADAICFGEDQKTIINGQHRLWAIVEANTAIEADVVMNVPIAIQTVIDGSIPRTAVDVMHIVHGQGNITSIHTAIAKRLMENRVKGALTRTEQIAALTKHEKAIAFAIGAFGNKNNHVRGITTSTVMTVIARAYYTQPHDKLERFCKVLQTGLSESTDEAIIVHLRNTLLNTNDSTKITLKAVYGKTERALAAYLTGEKLPKSHLVAPNGELFFLPGEPRPRAREETRSVKLLRKKAKVA